MYRSIRRKAMQVSQWWKGKEGENEMIWGGREPDKCSEGLESALLSVWGKKLKGVIYLSAASLNNFRARLACPARSHTLAGTVPPRLTMNRQSAYSEK